MKGFYFESNRNNEVDDSLVPAGLKLLFKNPDMEIMTQNMVAQANVWICPAEDNTTTEFFFIHSGSVSVRIDGNEQIFRAGDYFYINQLEKDVPLHVLEDTQMLYISNTAMFDETHDFEKYINQLITQINEKDHYTYQHSANVLLYSTQIFEKLNGDRKSNEAILNDMLVAALFHDVGKCYIPDEILKKKGRLDDDEMKYIYRHPTDSALLLSKHYSRRVAEIAEHHHERIDGTGYPYGLHGDDISHEARIVAVADAFDAMTTDRGYNRVKSFREAAEELCSLPDKFDSTVTAALLEIINDGTFKNGGQQR